MKVAWLIGSVVDQNLLEHAADWGNSGGWLYTQLHELSLTQSIEEIVIISVANSYKEDSDYSFQKFRIFQIKDKPIRWSLNYKTFSKIDRIIEKTKPDVLDVQGTETSLSCYPMCKKCGYNVKTINTLHGIAFQCSRFYGAGMPIHSLFCGRTIRDNITLRGNLEGWALMKRRADYENQLLKSIKYVRGRTKWDRASVLSVNPSLSYHSVELIMREPFYKATWNIENSSPNTIFITQSHIPYKGLYIFLQALGIVKREVPDIRVRIPGVYHSKRTQYGAFDKLIANTIREFDLVDNIEYLGKLDANQMVSELLNARLFVQPSIIENSPNSLAEAQLVGTPNVSAFTGGVVDYVENKETGVLYNPLDPVMCADCVMNLLKNDALSVHVSERSRAVARTRHDKAKATRQLLETYHYILN